MLAEPALLPARIKQPEEEILVIRIAVAFATFRFDHVIDAFKLAGTDLILCVVYDAFYMVFKKSGKPFEVFVSCASADFYDLFDPFAHDFLLSGFISVIQHFLDDIYCGQQFILFEQFFVFL